MPDCYEFRKLINKLIDNEISFSEKKKLREHIDECVDCKKCLEKSIKMKRMLAQLPKVKTSEDFNILLRARIRREAHRERNKLFASFTLPKRTVKFAFGIIVIMLFILIINPVHLIRNDSEKQMSVSENNNDQFNGRIQYVIDKYPHSISLSREDSRENTIDSLIIKNDSLNNRRSNIVRTHATPVNF